MCYIAFIATTLGRGGIAQPAKCGGIGGGIGAHSVNRNRSNLPLSALNSIGAGAAGATSQQAPYLLSHWLAAVRDRL